MEHQEHEDAARVLRPWVGSATAQLLGEGMEGAVYAISEDRVAKLWTDGSQQALVASQAFHTQLSAKKFTFEVPEIHEVHVLDGQCVTIERRLAGATMADRLAGGELSPEVAQTALVGIVAELDAAGPFPAGRALSVLNENPPLYSPGQQFPQALAALVERRVHQFESVLTPAVEHLPRKLSALPDRLRDIDSGRRCVIHGDLFPGNILVDDVGGVAAVLDWGFLTTEGDPVFDAAVAASIFDMYGPAALETELNLYSRMQERLGCSREALLVYRAAYSLITANAYDPEGKDGHFAWCVAALNRPDVAGAILG